jgi:uncharacterized protein HemX
MEAAWAAIAVVTSIGGGLYTTVYHSGASAAQILELQQKQAETVAHVAKHDDQLSTIQQTQAAQNQKLQDIADTVHDMRDNGVKRK